MRYPEFLGSGYLLVSASQNGQSLRIAQRLVIIPSCKTSSILLSMIKSWLHKGLKNFFETGSRAGIQAAHARRLEERLQVINRAKSVQEINFPAYRLHQLKGDRSDIWSITVTGNWRITFRFEDGDAYILNYEDYH